MGQVTLILVVPLLGAVAVGFFGQKASWARGLALIVSTSAIVPVLALWTAFKPQEVGYQFIESSVWIPSLGASYLVGVDTLGLLFVVLIAVVTPLVVLGSWSRVNDGARGYYSILLLLESMLMGMFLAVDLLLFATFWWVGLSCVGFLISLGGERDSARAALRFWVVTMGSSLLLLAVFAVCHHIHTLQSGAPSFDARHFIDLVLRPNTEVWLFWMSFAAFGGLVPLIPFNFWLQGSVQEASLAGRVLICAVLVKVGVLGLLRFAVPWFPRAATTYAPFILTLAVVSLLYGAVTLVFESDLARMLARVTAMSMGLAVFGLFSFHPDGIKGSVVLMLSHGILITAWFLWMGMLEKRTWFGQVPELIGLKGRMPLGTGVLAVLSAATIGVPTFGTFVGLFLVGRSFLSAEPPMPFKAVLAGIALILAAVVFVGIVKKAFSRKGVDRRQDLGTKEVLVLIPLLLLMVWMGVQPGGILGQMDRATELFVSHVSGASSLME